MTACMERTFRVQRLRVSLRGCGKWILHGKNSPNTNTTKFAINFDGRLDSFHLLKANSLNIGSIEEFCPACPGLKSIDLIVPCSTGIKRVFISPCSVFRVGSESIS